MTNFGSEFRDDKCEQAFNEDLLLFCHTIKAVAVEQGCPPIILTKLLKEIAEDVIEAYDSDVINEFSKRSNTFKLG
jgi:hypothetical protein